MKLKKYLKLVLFMYLFVLALELIQRASVALMPDVKGFLLSNLGPLKAISVGWFSAAIVQSSGVVGSVTVAFVGNELISLPIAVYILVGASLGTTIAAMIISLITESKQKKDFRHGFEIGLCYSIYSALLVIIVFFLEFFFGFFSGLSLWIVEHIGGEVSLLKVPGVIDIITGFIVEPIFDRLPIISIFILGFVILIFVLRFIGRVVIDVLGGDENARGFIDRHFDSKTKTYIIGAVLTGILFSSGITIGLLVPLAVSRLIGLKRSIPFILGADLGTSTDILLAALIIGKTNALAAAISSFLFAIVGAIVFLPNTALLFRMTKYVSKRLVKISRRKALYILIGFVLIPLVLILLF